MTIVSFESQKTYYEKLLKISKKYPQWELNKRCALGKLNGEAYLNVASNGASSSLLPMFNTHSEAAPTPIILGAKKEVTTLNEVSAEYLKKNTSLFVKLDVQGSEWNILQGAQQILPKIQGIQLESSLIPLYEGEMLFGDMKEYLEGQGFKLYDLIPGFRHSESKRLLQTDMIFLGTRKQ